MTTKYVPAELKSVEEFLQCMLDGEVFYNHDGTRQYCYKKGSGIFTCSGSMMSCINITWKYAYIKKETQWYEGRLPSKQGIVCWVNNYTEEYKCHTGLVTTHVPDSKSPFITSTGSSWKYATPVTPEDLT